MPRIVERPVPEESRLRLAAAGVPPVLARIYAARGVGDPRELESDLKGLLPFDLLHRAGAMGAMLADAIAARRRLLIVADYDADGATACAVGLRGLRALGADIDYLVPNRFEYGYGLTPEIVRLAAQAKRPDIIVTVDNGIASVEGVAEAGALGIEVLVTDHHLPGDTLPAAACIVNPNQPGCGFPSKSLAGVGVMFYVVLATRAELRGRGLLPAAEPNLAGLLDLVALGTVADVVRLDRNNRILVEQGLRRIRGGRAQPGVLALFRAAGREAARAATSDLGFMLGPRLNAAGRLTDMSLGIECLVTDDPARAMELARQLDALNRERRAIEAGMHDSARTALDAAGTGDAAGLCLFDPQWHQGVVGILASRIKDRLHRPVIAFARGAGGEIKGSGRSIRGFHLRDAIDLVTKRHPGLVLRFGGHAAAAGVSLREADFGRFAEAFATVAGEWLTPADLEKTIETDGRLDPADVTLETAGELERGTWGQGFPQPAFVDSFAVEDQRVVGEKHLRLRLRAATPAAPVEAMLFFHSEPLPDRIAAVYRLGVNEYNGTRRLQLTIEHWEAA